MVDILTVATSNKWKYVTGNKEVDLETDDFKVMLMQQGYVFDRDAHDYYSNISGDELPNDAYGYFLISELNAISDLSGGSYTEDGTYNLSKRTFTDYTLSASGGDIGPFKNIILIDWEIAGLSSDGVVVGCIALENNSIIADGTDLELDNIEIHVA